jgi:hypothetical protein
MGVSCSPGRSVVYRLMDARGNPLSISPIKVIDVTTGTFIAQRQCYSCHYSSSFSIFSLLLAVTYPKKKIIYSFVVI